VSDPIRTLIVEDDMLTRAGLAAILGTDDAIELVGEAATATDGALLAWELQPDIVLMDVRLPDLDGIEATRHILDHEAGSAIRVIVLTTFAHDEYVLRSLQAGASGFLLKRMPAEQLLEAVKTVASGTALVGPDETRQLVTEHTGPTPRPGGGLRELLTKREVDVLKLIARGYSNQEIASELSLSTETVRTHVKHIYWKCGARDRVHAVIAAYEQGITLWDT
jgi:DNA-binding NarL/FixJ family response regulator